MSACVLTRVVKALGAYARSRGLALLQYLDDWNISCSSFEAYKLWTDWLLRLAQSLAFLVNFKKSELTPSQVFQFVGILFDLILGVTAGGRSMVQDSTGTAHQQFGSTAFPAPGSGEACDSDVRQHHSDRSDSESGRDALPGPIRTDHSPIPVGGSSPGRDHTTSHTRSSHRDC